MSFVLSGCVQQPGVSEAEREAIRQEVREEVLRELATESESPAPTALGQDGYEVITVTEGVFPGVEINSAGGVSIHLPFRSNVSATIKYLRFNAVPFNAVDDPVVSEIGRKGQQVLKLTGPVERGVKRTATWKNVWYNSSVSYVLIESGEVIYMDESSAELVFDPPIRLDKTRPS